MGSIANIVGGSKYGNSNKAEYLHPNSDSFLALSVFYMHFIISATLSLCEEFDRGIQSDLSNKYCY